MAAALVEIARTLEPSLGGDAVEALLRPLREAFAVHEPAAKIVARLDVLESVMDAALLTGERA
ncbi:MAG: hypothetical protein Q8Q09_25875 [Deltaproteobacteria bacterium]|nr:hypothetical protein [Deltaproteobacteria bacterium]